MIIVPNVQQTPPPAQHSRMTPPWLADYKKKCTAVVVQALVKVPEEAMEILMMRVCERPWRAPRRPWWGLEQPISTTKMICMPIS
jgi:hypothetical protein